MKHTARKGQLVMWNDDRGFGFIQSSRGSPQTFLHISALEPQSRRPKIGDIIHYHVTSDPNGKLRAEAAHIEGVMSAVTRDKLLFGTEVIGLAILPLLGALRIATNKGQLIPLLLYILMSLITFALYAQDKTYAQNGAWRIPEIILHLCEMLGGWIGAFIAQHTLRHKSRKAPYQLTFWAIVTLHQCLWLGWLGFALFEKLAPP